MAMRIARPATAFSSDPSGKHTARMEDSAHLAFIRKLPSIISGRTGCEACHVRTGDPTRRKKRTGKGQKPDDAWTLPMTPDEHRAQHDGNEMDYYRANGIADPFEICIQLYAMSGEVEAATAYILKIVKGRR
jgi:hypothetical protein